MFNKIMRTKQFITKQTKDSKPKFKLRQVYNVT